MKKALRGREDTEQSVREAIRKRKWASAIAHYERRVQDADRDFSAWNRLGDFYWNHHVRAKAADAWRTAIEGFASEGLYENALGVARKVLRLTPDEETIHLKLADAYLGLEYYSDCLASLRSYLKLAAHPAEQDLRALIKRILKSSVGHRHLVEELQAIWADSHIEDFELQQQLTEYARQFEQHESRRETPVEEDTAAPAEGANRAAPTAGSARDDGHGLIGLESMEVFAESGAADAAYMPTSRSASMSAAEDTAMSRGPMDSAAEPPSGEGKDHYDLGTVYREMKLWDAAVAEFEQARKDPTMRIRATLSLAECLHEMDDLVGALDLLERERDSQAGDEQARIVLTFQIATLHELLGNLQEALRHFEAVREQNPGYGDVQERITELNGRLAGDTTM
ncbi:MAG: tetratricopeptide repeat protein [bacterium]|nr:tetratricopeptide repeat protein [bacterium]